MKRFGENTMKINAPLNAPKRSFYFHHDNRDAPSNFHGYQRRNAPASNNNTFGWRNETFHHSSGERPFRDSRDIYSSRGGDYSKDSFSYRPRPQREDRTKGLWRHDKFDEINKEETSKED